MRLPRLKIRTLLLLLAGIALLIELVGLGRRSRHYAAQAQAAASAEQVNRNVARNSRLAAGQFLEEADRIAANDPARAAGLRERAGMLVRQIPFFEAQARTSAQSRAMFERAVTHPWEGNPAVATRLATTPPPGP
jgi:hypothetical protein